MGVCKIIPVKNRLGEKLRKPGGVSRDEAVKAAGGNVESLREEFVGAIPSEISALEQIAMQAGRTRLSPDELDTMLRRAAQLLTLSGTFGFDLLDDVVKRFCDLANGMIEKNIDEVAPVAVHLRAMRLASPGVAELSADEGINVLSGLERVHKHYGISRIKIEETQAV